MNDMKYFEKLKEIAYQRQTGYTTAIKNIDAVILCNHKAMEIVFGKNNVVTVDDDLCGIHKAIIPDNHFLYITVIEVEEKIKELNTKILDLKRLNDLDKKYQLDNLSFFKRLKFLFRGKI